jgi:hypothetical protein
MQIAFGGWRNACKTYGSGCIKRDAPAVNENFQHNVRKLLILKNGIFD